MKKLLTILLLAGLSFNATAQGLKITITGNPLREDGSPDLIIAGFNIYYGTAPGDYEIPINIPSGADTVYTIPNLPDGTYYAVVTEYDTAGRESIYTPEMVATLVTADPKPPTATMEVAP
jgi:hypothetical protein